MSQNRGEQMSREQMLHNLVNHQKTPQPKTPKNTKNPWKSYHLLPKVTICCQKLPFVAKSFHLLPKVTMCCQKLPFVAKSFHLLPKVSKSFQQNNVKQGDILSRRQIVPGQYMSRDDMSRDNNICPRTICRGTKCRQTTLRPFTHLIRVMSRQKYKKTKSYKRQKQSILLYDFS